jgi:RNA polymerase sigma-70 factor (ECF subfamily)
MSPSDRELVELVTQRRDEGAFRQLYRRHTPALFRIAARLARTGTGSAEDLVHETWIKAFDRLGSFQWRSRLATWLTGILLNLVRETWRSEARREASWADSLVEPPAPESRMDERLDLDRAIAALAPGYRSVLVLHDVEGYKHHEIAELLGIDEGTSKSQLARARLALRRWLEPGRRLA